MYYNCNKLSFKLYYNLFTYKLVYWCLFYDQNRISDFIQKFNSNNLYFI